jgi:hypothetical protein
MPAADDDPSLEWHRRFAAQGFNRAWELIEKPDRSGDEDGEMLAAAFASRFHWERVGEDEQRIVGDWQISHVASLVGFADLALAYARAALDRAMSNGFTGWRLASGYEGMARAHATAGNSDERDRFILLAEKSLEMEDDAEERDLIGSQLRSIPGYSEPSR